MLHELDQVYFPLHKLYDQPEVEVEHRKYHFVERYPMLNLVNSLLLSLILMIEYRLNQCFDGLLWECFYKRTLLLGPRFRLDKVFLIVFLKKLVGN